MTQTQDCTFFNKTRPGGLPPTSTPRESETAKFQTDPSSQQGVSDQIRPQVRPHFTPEMREKAREARRTATPKRAFARAIQEKCEECCGFNPAVTDCGGYEVNDGLPCRLYHLNTRGKRRKHTKSALKRAILQECKFCMTGNPLSDCSSQHCALHPYGPGRRPAANVDRMGIEGPGD